MKTKFLGGLCAALVAGALLAGPAVAQNTAVSAPATPAPVEEGTGSHAGTILVRARLIDVIPLNSSSSISGIGGSVRTTSSVMPELDFSYFVTDNIAFELIAATTEHKITANGTAIGNPTVGHTWVLPPALTAQYHFFPKEKINPYLGAGINYTIFYGVRPGGGAVTSLSLQNNVGAVVQAGIDFDLGGPWVANIDVKQIFVNTKANLNGGAIVAKTALNPLVVGVGVGYRF